MTVVLYVCVLSAALVFVAATARRAVTYARCPIHLRWELYPVPHESPGRVAHGGSYFETGEWWRAPRQFSLIGELKAMVPEMLFLRALHESNRALWRRSFPFHFGLYLLGFAALAVLTLEFGGALVGGVPAAVASVFNGVILVAGTMGLLSALAGAAALLHRRLTDPDLRPYTTAGDLFNLTFFIGAFGLLAIGVVVDPGAAAGLLAFAHGLVAWDVTLQVSPVLAAGIVTSSVLVAYIPLTHMSHFVGKYFTYHAVRWDDRPARGDRRVAAAMAEYLTYRPTWEADHLKSGGTKTWGEVASTNPTVESRP